MSIPKVISCCHAVENTLIVPDRDVLLDIKQLSVSYQAAEAEISILKSINLEIAAGEIVALVGPTGSGKSTVAKSILHLLPASACVGDAAQIVVCGKNIRTIDDQELRQTRHEKIGVITQNPYQSLDPTMRSAQQVFEVMDGKKSERSKKLADFLGQIGIRDAARVMRSYPHQLSIGQCQRIAAAMAMVSNPAVLIADEPTSALDEPAARQLEELIKNHANAALGRGVLLISHDLHLVSRLATRWHLLLDGVLKESGRDPILEYHGEVSYLRDLVDVLKESHSDQPPSLQSANPIFELQDLEYRHRNQKKSQEPAIRVPSWQIYRGQMIGMHGASGSGKSTLMQILGGLLTDYQGSATFKGREIRKRIGEDRLHFHAQIQYVFQDSNASLPPRMSVGKVLRRALSNFSNHRDRQELSVGQLADAVQLDRALLERTKQQLSGGEQQRVAIARALAAEPEVILFDESLASLDRPVQVAVLDTIRGIQKHLNCTIIMVSHDRELLRYFSPIAYEIVDHELHIL